MRTEIDIKRTITKRWDARARTYDRSPGHGIHSDQEKKAWMQILSSSLDNKQQLKVLDVGTGTGALAILLAEMGHEVVGIDLSKKMLKIADEKASSLKLNAQFRVGDAEAPPFERESFHAIVCRHLLWTLPNPGKAIKEWKNLLKPGGRLVIIDGDWAKYKRTRLQEAWRVMAMPLIFVTEFRDPRMRQNDLNEYLPLRKKERPAADIKLLENAGFEVCAREVELPRKYSLLNYIKYGYSRYNRYQFVISGVKAA